MKGGGCRALVVAVFTRGEHEGCGINVRDGGSPWSRFADVADDEEPHRLLVSVCRGRTLLLLLLIAIIGSLRCLSIGIHEEGDAHAPTFYDLID
jgi:hypothetical protein